MSKMRQTADGGLPKLRQKTPDACGETPTLSERNLAPVAFSLNQSSALCLPLVTDSKKFIWVHSDQLNLQVDGAAELDKAFDRFPYQTQNQTVALAQRCSLHPDQVKVWFMVQRLRYGISWDYKDILKVQRKLKSSREKEGWQNDRRENNKWKRVVKESGGKKAEEVREEMGSNKGAGENLRANEQLEKKTKQRVMDEKDRKGEELEDDKRNSQKKRKMLTMTDKMGKKRRVDESFLERAGEVRKTSDVDQRESTKPSKSEIMLFTIEKKKAKSNERLLSLQDWPAHESFVVPDEALDVHPLLNSSTKTRRPLAMIREAFLHCQYLDREAYDRLAELTGTPRRKVVQWFNDMRYYVKKVRPGWIDEELHSKVRTNIKFQQWLRALPKPRPSEGSRRATWKMKLERSESCGHNKSVQVPPE